MKNIKNFKMFFENNANQNYEFFGPFIYLITSSDEVYGLPILSVYEKDDEDLPEVASMQELIDNYLEADHGPIHGSDCWHHIDDAIDEYREDPSEENLDSIEGWLMNWNMDDEFDAKRLVDDPEHYTEAYNRYVKNNVTYFINNYKIDPIYNYIILNHPEFEIRSEEENLEYSGDNRYPLIKNMLEKTDLPLIILAYNNDSDEIFWLTKEGKIIPTGFSMDSFNEDYNPVIIKVLEDLKKESPLDFSSIVKSIQNIVSFEKIASHFVKDADIVKGGSALRRFGIGEED